MSELAAQPNPIAERYAGIASAFLEARIGKEITTEMAEYLVRIMESHVCNFCNLQESADILGVTRQRAFQLSHSGGMPPEAGQTSSGKFWLKEDVMLHEDIRNKAPGRPAK
jgi:hypothetical protein